MNGWQSIRLGDLCRIELGRTPARRRAELWDPERVTDNVWLSIADLPRELHAEVTDSKEYISDLAARAGRVVPKGTLMVSFKLTLGRLATAGKDLFTNEAIAALHELRTDVVSQRFLYWYLSYFDWDKASEGDHKVKGRTLNKAKLQDLVVFFPPISEQERIVVTLDEAFAAIDTATANAEKNRINARDLFAIERDRVLLDFEEDWVVRPLGELVEIKHGFAFKSDGFVDHADHILLTPGNFFESGGYRDRGAKQKYFSGTIPDGFILRGDDLLLAMTEQAVGLLGSPMVVPESDRFLHNQRLGLVQPFDKAHWHSPFFFHVFNTTRFRSAVQRSASGVKVRHTSPQKLRQIPVAYPEDAAIQRTIARRLDRLAAGCEALSEAQSRKIAVLASLKDAVLAAAFTGELAAPTESEVLVASA